MPRYIGEGPREMYWQDSQGKWHHTLGNGKSFDSMKDAEDDYKSQGHVGWVDTPQGVICIAAVLLILLIFFH